MPSQFLTRIQKLPRWAWVGIAAGGIALAGIPFLVQTRLQRSGDAPQAITVESQNLTARISANGTVQAVRQTNLSPKNAGRITQLSVQEGDRVKTGQVIAQMENSELRSQVEQYRAALAQTEADLAQRQAGNRVGEIAEARARVAAAQATVGAAQAKLNRAQEELSRNQVLAQSGAISRNELEKYIAQVEELAANVNADQARQREQQHALELLQEGTRVEEITQAEAKVAEARARLQQYETQLNDTLIRAPFDGIITQRFAQEGDFVTPTTSASTGEGATSTSIAELSQGLEVEASVPEASIAKIKPGQSVEVRADAYPDQAFQARVRLIAPRAIKEENVTIVRVKTDLQTGEAQLRSGLNVRLTFLGDTLSEAVVVPLAAIVTQQNGQTGVLVETEAGKAEFRPVTVGVTVGDKVQVMKGLASGDRVLLEPPEGQQIPGVTPNQQGS